MKSKGFTLIELMIVIAIIGILVSFSISSWRVFRNIIPNKQQIEIIVDKDKENMIQSKKQSKFQGEY